MRYLIRPLKEQDIPAIIEGETKAFGRSLGFDLIYSDLHLNPYAHYLVLEINKKVNGYIGLWITPDGADVINFYVDKEYQGRGFGKKLLKFAIDLCTMSKVKQISLEVRENNEVAIALYEKMGFKFSHKRERYYSDNTDALVMIKELEV
jgi:ribosomal-protein-alanine N-acetyltransferase